MSQSIHTIIPEDEQRCIWMDAGITSYHLCDSGFHCDTCTFDAQIRMQRSAALHHAEDIFSGAAAAAAAHTEDRALSARTAEEFCASTMEDLLRSIGGSEYPDDRLYASNHTWAKKGRDGSYTIGVDHFIGAMLAGAHSVACALPSTRVIASEPYAWIIAGGETLAVRSPLSGRILDCNTALAGFSGAIHTDPYTQGWIARIHPDSEASDSHALMSEKEMARVMKTDCDTYRRSVNAELTRMQAQLDGTMYDGGTVLGNFEDILGTAKYYEIIERFLRSK
jgi:glycine cleavage system H protein